MTSSADSRRRVRPAVVRTAALALVLGSATGAHSAGPVAPGAAGPAVRSAVAARWGVDPARVRLEWGRGADRLPDDPDAPVTLAGGAGGWWVVSAGRGPDTRAARVRAGVLVARPVAARPLVAGDRLAAADVATDSAIAWGAPERGASVPGPGWVVRRALGAGDPLQPPAVTPPTLVRAGSPVRVRWARGPVAVVREGIALNDAVAGGRVRVRLAERAAPVDAVARAAGEAIVEGGTRP